MAPPLTFVVGLGSNLGDRLAYLRDAAARVADLGRVISGSSVYETEPVGPAQGRYLNAALSLQSSAEPTQLMRSLLEVEQGLGRERRERWGPRTIDLDLLWSDGPALSELGLTLPHPRLSERGFALRPLLDVVPDACDPASGVRYDLILAALVEPNMTLVARPHEWLPSLDFRRPGSADAPR